VFIIFRYYFRQGGSTPLIHTSECVMFLLGAKERFPRPASINCSSSSTFGVFFTLFFRKKKVHQKDLPSLCWCIWCKTLFASCLISKKSWKVNKVYFMFLSISGNDSSIKYSKQNNLMLKICTLFLAWIFCWGVQSGLNLLRSNYN